MTSRVRRGEVPAMFWHIIFGVVNDGPGSGKQRLGRHGQNPRPNASRSTYEELAATTNA